MKSCEVSLVARTLLQQLYDAQLAWRQNTWEAYLPRTWSALREQQDETASALQLQPCSRISVRLWNSTAGNGLMRLISLH